MKIDEVQADAAQLAVLQEHAKESAPVTPQVCTGYLWTEDHDFVRIMGEMRHGARDSGLPERDTAGARRARK